MWTYSIPGPLGGSQLPSKKTNFFLHVTSCCNWIVSGLGNAIPISRDLDLARSLVILRDQSRNINWRDHARLTRLSATSQRRITRVLGARTTLQEELEEALRACKHPFLRVSTSIDRLESHIKKEMDLYVCWGNKRSIFTGCF